MCGSLFALVFVQMIAGFVGDRGGPTEATVFTILTVIFAVGFGLPIELAIVLLARGFVRDGGIGTRLPAFAAANGLTLVARSETPPYPGAIFRSQFRSWAFQRLVRTEPRLVEVGNLATQIPAGRTTTLDTWGYIAVRLDRSLPHILLEATASGQNTHGALPVSVDRSQRLSLEGDFDAHFTLFCPKDYETDALYLLTPDVMALLIDRLGGWHVEIVDDWLFVFAPHDVVTGADAALYARIFAVVDVLTAKVTRQTRRYRDDRDGMSATPLTAEGIAPVTTPIAPPGRQLVPGTSPYNRLFAISLGVIGGFIVLFLVGTFVALGVVTLVYGPPTP